jgi:hypothetical protein
MKVNKKRGHCEYKVQKKADGTARCKKNKVVVGRAASGGIAHASIKGRKVFGWIKCCDAISSPHYTYYDDRE